MTRLGEIVPESHVQRLRFAMNIKPSIELSQRLYWVFFCKFTHSRSKILKVRLWVSKHDPPRVCVFFDISLVP